MKFIHRSRLLKLALLADATVTVALAAAQLLLATALSERLKLPHALLLESGFVMLGYAALILWFLRSEQMPLAGVAGVVIGNVGWALACLGLLVAGTPPTNAPGAGFLMVHAAGALGFAGLEFKGMRASPFAVN